MTADEHAIVRIANLYALAIDARRWDLFDRIFTPDVRLDYPSRRWNDRAAFKADFAAQHAPYTATQHMMHNHLVELAGSRACAVTYCSWRLIEDRRFIAGGAWYDDTLLRADGGWRIDRRDCRIIWSDSGTTSTAPGEGPKVTRMADDAHAGRIAFLNAFDATGHAIDR